MNQVDSAAIIVMLILMFVVLAAIRQALVRVAAAIESNHDQCWVNKKPEGGVGYDRTEGAR